MAVGCRGEEIRRAGHAAFLAEERGDGKGNVRGKGDPAFSPEAADLRRHPQTVPGPAAGSSSPGKYRHCKGGRRPARTPRIPCGPVLLPERRRSALRAEETLIDFPAGGGVPPVHAAAASDPLARPACGATRPGEREQGRHRRRRGLAALHHIQGDGRRYFLPSGRSQG